MQFRRHGRTERDGCKKEENSIALEQSKRKNIGKGFSFNMGFNMQSVHVPTGEQSYLEGVYPVRRSQR